MILQTERLILKPLGIEYLQTVNKYATDIENTRYMVHLPNENIEETKRFLTEVDEEWKKEKPSFYEFAILLGNVHVGAVSVYLTEDFSIGELGWIIDKTYWKNGYAYEASSELVNMCIKELGIHHFIAHCDSENMASRKVMEKLGMKLVEQYSGRKNRASDEVREECMYCLDI